MVPDSKAHVCAQLECAQWRQSRTSRFRCNGISHPWTGDKKMGLCPKPRRESGRRPRAAALGSSERQRTAMRALPGPHFAVSGHARDEASSSPCPETVAAGSVPCHKYVVLCVGHFGGPGATRFERRCRRIVVESGCGWMPEGIRREAVASSWRGKLPVGVGMYLRVHPLLHQGASASKMTAT